MITVCNYWVNKIIIKMKFTCLFILFNVPTRKLKFHLRLEYFY